MILTGRTALKSQLAPVFADAHVFDLEVDQMASAVADVGAAGLQAIAPAVKVELAVIEFHVNAPRPTRSP